MTWATPKVEINFRTSLANADNWIDVTSKVLGTIQIDRGRQSELDQYGASTCRFSLINIDREFDFTYAAGPRFGQLLPRTEVRVTCLFSAVTYNLWRGFIQGWPQGYDNEARMATVEIQAVDRFDLLAQSHWVGGPATTYLKNLNPAYWLRSVFSDGVDNTDNETELVKSAVTEDGSARMLFEGDAWGNASDGDPIQSDIKGKGVARTENDNDPSTSGRARTTRGDEPFAHHLLTQTTTWTAGGWFRSRTIADQVNTSGVGGMMSLGGITAPGGVQLNWVWNGLPGYVNSRLTLTARHWGGGVVSASINHDGNLSDDKWHHIVATNAPNDLRLYVDGNLVGSTTAFGSSDLDDSAGLSLASTSAGGNYRWNGWAYDLFGFNRTLTPTEVYTLYYAGVNLPSQSSGNRVYSLLYLFGMQSIAMDIANGNSLMAPVDIDGGSLLDSLLEAVKAEGGRLYMDADGTLVFRGRLDNLVKTRSTTVQATFDDTGSNIRYLEASPTLDVQYMFNQITTSTKGGTDYQVNDATSQTAYGVRSMDNTGLGLASENDAISQAQWLAAKYSMPKARLPFMRFSPRTSSAAMTAALSLNLADRISISRKPQNLGLIWSFNALIEGLSHTIDLSNLSWDTTYNLTQTDIISGYMKIGDATDGHLDTAKLAG
jgi:hypothetical protein